jgi:hypothetical protein
MLNSLSGAWRLQPLTIHLSELPHVLANIKLSSRQMRLQAAVYKNSKQIKSTNLNEQLSKRAPLMQRESSLCQVATAAAGATNDSSSCNSLAMNELPPGLVMDSEGNISATLVKFEQLAQPKGEQLGHTDRFASLMTTLAC